MIDGEALLATLADAGLAALGRSLCAAAERKLRASPHGMLAHWQALVGALPAARPSAVDLDRDRPLVGTTGDLTPEQHDLRAQLLQLKPWRKGPFELFGCHVDSEWRSDFKWRRLAPHIAPLAGRRVLDVGCGNGYHCWRMRGAGAALAIGIDPGQLGLAQFAAIKRYLPEEPVFQLPLADRELPAGCGEFDTLFSMGVLQHSRAPEQHLSLLYPLLRGGGELVLEGLVIPGEGPGLLIPEGRYASMRNVWALPTPALVEAWLRQAGFHRIRLADVNRTTPEEQRRTDWMSFQSLADFLDPEDPARTIEGHPAPTRALFIAEKPS